MKTENIKDIENICGKYGAELLLDAPIAPYTSFKIGGNCDIVKVNGCGVLTELLRYCETNGVKRHIMGKGSNVLVSDKGLDGLTIIIANDFGNIKSDEEIIEAEAGAKLSEISRFAYENGLTGLEFACGIPGSVGGALYMNAGAYGGEIKDVVISCEYIDTSGGNFELCGLKRGELGLSYRRSVFCDNGGIIVSVCIKLKRGDKITIKTRMEEIMRLRREKQPLDYPSAGSTFKRPAGHYAAKLIDECGLRGLSVGDAQVSEKHCGFIVNKGGALFDDVKELIALVREKVRAQTGIELECEIRILE